MKTRASLLILACLILTWVVLACNLSEQGNETYLKIKLDDSLSTYDTIRVDILYPDGKVYKDSVFYGKYNPDPDHELKNINLGENPPTEFRIRITGIRGGKRTLEIAIPVTSAGAQPSELVFRDTTKAPVIIEPKKVEISTPSPVVLFTRASAFAISASVQPMGAAPGLLWRSSDSGVALVDSAGKVYPLIAGEADITARSQSDTSLFAVLHLVVKDSVLIKGIKVSSESLLLYTGGESRRLTGEIDPPGVGLSVVFTSKNDTIANAGADGTISPAKPGNTEILVYPAGMPELAVAVAVKVIIDMPKLDAGSDRYALAKDTLAFPLKVTQDYGTVAALKWDLDGNGIWDDSTTMAEANPRRVYDGKDTLVTVHFYVRDSEGNVALVDKLVHVGQRLPLAAPAFTSATTPSPTRVVRPTWVWSGTKGGSGNFRFALDNKPEIQSRALSFTADSLADGEHTLVLRELDSLGEPSLPASRIIKIVTKGPLVTITSPAPGFLTNANSVNVVWNIKAQDGTTTAGNSIEGLAGKQGGIWIVRSEVDAFGNRGADSIRIFRDTIPPAAPAFTAQTSPAVVNASYATPVQWAWTRTGAPNDSFVVSLNGGASTRNAGMTYVLANPQNQNYSLEVREVDSAGNASAPITFVIQIDKAAPPAPVVNGVSPSGTPVWTWTPGPGSDGARIYRYKLSTASGYSAETSAITHSLTTLGTGTHTLLVQERDLAGNWSADGPFAIEVDKTGPTVAIGKPTPMGSVTNSNPIVSGSVSDDHSIKKAEYRLNGGTYVPLTLAGSNWSFKDSCDAGMNSFWIRAEDQFGNRDSVSLKIHKYPNVVFVRKNATGAGKSWEDAYGEMFQALDTTKKYQLGTEIWVTRGTYDGYLPASQKEMNIVWSNFKLIGGFFQDRPSVDDTQRDLSLGATTIVTQLYCGRTTYNPAGIASLTIDGFTFKGGLPQDWGIGSGTHNQNMTFRNIKIDALDEEDTPFHSFGDNTLIENCEFTNNLSYGTTLMWLQGETTMRNCRFVNNRTISGGYAPISFEILTVDGGYFENNQGETGMFHLSLSSNDQQLFIDKARIQGGQGAIHRQTPTTGTLSYGSGNISF